MRGEHELLKPTHKPPLGLCIKCGKLTPAICGVFDLLCPDCLEEKRQTKGESFFNDRD